MARVALTKEFKLGFIEAHLEIYKESHPSAKIDDYKDVDDKTLNSYYRKVSNCVNGDTVSENTSVEEVDIVTPISILKDTIKNTLKKNLTYEEWKDIKEEAEKFVEKIEGKMKDAASDALKKKEEELAKLQADIAELKTKLN